MPCDALGDTITLAVAGRVFSQVVKLRDVSLDRIVLEVSLPVKSERAAA